MPPAPILVGTANWTDHRDFYPPGLDRGGGPRDRLAYYARFFPFVEVDTTFYGIPRPAVVEGWLARTPPGFRFSIKAFRSLTRHERDGGVPRPPTREEVQGFLAAVEPLKRAGRLDAVHYQFPPWFTDTPASREILLEARERHPDDIVAVELRHRSWYDGEAWPRTEELLREMGATYVMVDAPQLGSGTAPPVTAVTSRRLAIVRMHGRNRRTWYIRGAASSTERFDWLYRPEELAEWAAPIRAIAAAGTPVHVVLNNNNGNQAVVNAFDMAALLDIPLPRPPAPVLATISTRDGEPPPWAMAAAEPPPWPGEEAAGSQLGLELDGR